MSMSEKQLVEIEAITHREERRNIGPSQSLTHEVRELLAEIRESWAGRRETNCGNCREPFCRELDGRLIGASPAKAVTGDIEPHAAADAYQNSIEKRRHTDVEPTMDPSQTFDVDGQSLRISNEVF